MNKTASLISKNTFTAIALKIFMFSHFIFPIFIIFCVKLERAKMPNFCPLHAKSGQKCPIFARSRLTQKVIKIIKIIKIIKMGKHKNL